MNLFPDFDDNLREAFRRETELFFGSIVSEDRSVLDLLTADYTFVNERLAKHYGIPEPVRPAVPPRDAARRTGHAPRPAGQGRAADRHLAGGAHLAGDSRQVVPANVPGRQPAGSAARTCRPSRRSRPTAPGTSKRRRCGRSMEAASHQSGRAPRATRSSSRWAWRWKTSTPWAPGGPRTRDSPIDASGGPGGRHQGGRRRERCATCSSRYSGSVRARRHREAAHLRAGPRRRVSGHAAGAVDRARVGARRNYRFSSLVLGIVQSPAFQMNMKTADTAQQQAAR